METYTKLSDILDPEAVERNVAEGMIRRQTHPDFPELSILNYTEKCAWERAWTLETLSCRGLIVHAGFDPVVLARPFNKFFNHDEGQHNPSLMCGPVEVTDKMDGSLGIGYYHHDMWRVATRGSFASEQAKWATDWLNNEYIDKHSMFGSRPGWTPLWEIVYPENRIVVDYHGYEGLVLLGWRHIDTGQVRSPLDFHDNWQGDRAETLEGDSLESALAMPPRENAEGIVIRWTETGLQLKVKQDDYKRLHAVVTNTTNRSVWYALCAGLNPLEMEGLPDEFSEWVRKTTAHLTGAALAINLEASAKFTNIMCRLGGNHTRGDFATLAKMSTYAPALFQLYDGKDITDWCWKQVKPETITRPFADKVQA